MTADPGLDPVPAPASAPAVAVQNGRLAVERSRCDGARCQLTFTFSHAMVKASQLSRAKPVAIKFSPAQRGKWNWKSPTELLFTPAKGAMHWGHRIDIRLEKAVPLAGEKHALAQPWRDPLTVPNFSIAGKWTSWPVIEGRPRFVAVLDGLYNNEIGRGPVFLAFDQPVRPTDVARHLRATAGDSKLKVAVWRPKTIARVWSEGRVDRHPIVAVRITNLPRDGDKVALHIPKTFTRGERSGVEKVTKRFVVRQTLAVKGVELSDTTDGNRAPLRARWRVKLTGSVNSKNAERAITVVPKPKSMNVYASGSSAYVYARLEPGTRYRLSVASGMRDKLGNVLARGTKRTFMSQDLVPKLELPKHAALLEAANPKVAIRATNIKDVKIRSHKVGSAEQFVKLLASGSNQCAIPDSARPSAVANKTARNKRGTIQTAVAAEPGLACVSVSGRGVGSEAEDDRLTATLLTQVTDLGITAKVHKGGLIAWVTRLSDAKPVPSATVLLYDDSGAVVSKGIADNNGIVRLEGKHVTSRGKLASSFVVARAKSDIAITHLTNKRVSQPWQFGLRGEVAGSESLIAAVFTDRGVYRPKETVRVKVVAKDTNAGGALMPLRGEKVQVKVSDARGRSVFNKKLVLDRFGATDAAVEIKQNAAVGKYNIRIQHGSDRVTTRSFRVEEYRVPTFEVAVKSDTNTWANRKRAQISIGANYLHGGKLAARKVAYTVSRSASPLAPARFPQFKFGLPHQKLPEGALVAKQGKLDGQGALSFDFAPSHPAAAGPMRYTVDASVTDVDRQVYAGRLSRVVHPSSIYVGVRHPTRKVLEAGETVKVPVIAIDPAGVAKAGVRVTVTAETVDHHTTARIGNSGVQRRNRPVVRRVASCRVKTSHTAKSCTLKLGRAGHYRITARAVDSKRRKVASGFEVTVGGAQRIAWPRFDHERIEILTDKPSYRVGDIAKLAVQSPFARARGILTLERGGVLEHRAFEIKDNTPVISIPIKAEHSPNIYASVVLLRGRVHNRADATGFQTGAPAFRVGYTQLAVEPRAARLAVNVALDNKVVAPRGKLGVKLKVVDATGAPIDGQATIMVVDEAVLGLTRYKTPNPIAQLYRPRPLGVRTASSRLDLPHSRRARREPIFPGGGGGDWDDGEDHAPDLESLDNMRNLFESTAYWNPRVVVNKGHAEVEVTLPDNLTTFRVMAIVVDDGSRAGSSQAKVTVRKPVMVKPVLPRFVHPGDTMVVQARVFNGGNEAGVAKVAAHFVGMNKLANPTASQMVAPGRSAMFSFPIKVVGTGEAQVRFAAAIGTDKDAVEMTLPILDPGTRRKVIETRTISGTGEIELKLPKQRISGSTSLEVIASSTSLSELRGAVDYVMGYPNGCIEQTTSTAYPLVVLEDLLPDMGVTVDKAQLRKYAEAGVKRLLSFQTSAGGLAYWPGSDKPHAFGTAFGLTALIAAKQRGYVVPDKALAEMAAYLENSLKTGKISDEMPHGGMADADTRALFVMTLGRLGRPRPADIATLWRSKDKLTGFGLSFLAVAVEESKRDRSLLRPILAEIRKRATETSDEAYFKGKRDQGWSMGSPLRTHAAALLAFASTARDGSMSPKLFKGLLSRKRGGMWGNTQENVFGIMAVAKAIQRRTGGGTTKPKVSLALNGKPIATSALVKLSKRTLQYKGQLADGEPVKVLVNSNGSTPTIVTVRAEYDEPLTPSTMAPVDSGFAVARTYETLASNSLEHETIRLGDIVRVRVRVKTGKAHNYVAIADRLPAGLEPLNTSLATTQKVTQRVAGDAAARGLGVLSYSESRDARVAFYADDLPAGTYEFTYLARATTAGTFRRPAAQADAMYEPTAVGTSAIDSVVIK